MGKYGIKGNPTKVREGLEQVPANLSDLRVSAEPRASKWTFIKCNG